MIDNHIAVYNKTIERIDSEASEREDNVRTATEAMQKHIVVFESKGLFSKVWSYFPYKFRKTAIHKDIDNNRKLLARKPDFEKDALEVLVLESARQLMLSGEHNEELKRLEEQHTVFRKMYSDATALEREALTAIDEVNSAISSLSSAQSMEMFDMATDSKAISMMSTIENISASDTVSQASNAVQRFQSKLEQQQRTWDDVAHNTSIETIDFMFDMFFDSDLLDTVGSFCSMLALSGAESDLQKVRSGLSEIADKLSMEVCACRDKLKTHEWRSVHVVIN